MLTNINLKENEQRVAIVAVGYIRPMALRRLLDSLEASYYPVDNVPLVISVDGSGDEKTYNLARNFRWSHGDKYVNIEENGRLGLVKHIYQCADLTNVFRAIVLLEDDLFVSPYFYSYVLQSLEKYGDEPEIAQIALYNNETNGFVGQLSPRISDGYDVFLGQSTCSWGECWNARMWKNYCDWRDGSCTEEIILAQDMPARIKGWKRAWSRSFNAFLLNQKKYVLFPQISLSTNFSDAGEHGDSNNNIVQVNLQQGNFKYRMPSMNDIQRYDSFINNEALYEWLSMDRETVCLDVFGFRERTNQRYILSTRMLPYKVVKSFALNMRPIELYVKYDVPGKGLYLYDTTVSGKGNSAYSRFLGEYHLQRMNRNMIISFLKNELIKDIRRKVDKLIKK